MLIPSDRGFADDELVERYAVRSYESSARASRKSGTRRTDFEERRVLEDGRAIEESLAGRIFAGTLVVCREGLGSGRNSEPQSDVQNWRL